MSSSSWSIVAVAGAAAALLAALTPVVARWRQRRLAGIKEPARLLDPAPRAIASQIAALVLVLAVVFAASQSAAHLRTSLAFLLAAYACCTISHLHNVRAAGVGGLMLAAAAIITAFVSRLAPSHVNLCLGLAVAGALFGWFARFWKQQLLDGFAWTTTGRLIPAASLVGAACTAASIAESARRLLVSGGDAWDSFVSSRGALAALLFLAGAFLAVRNAMDWRRGWRDAPLQR